MSSSDRIRPWVVPAVALGVALIILPACFPPTTTPTPPTTTAGGTTTTSTTTSTTASTTTTTVPPLVAITGSDPASPSLSFAPRLIGFAPAATTTVRIFASTNCTGPTIGGGDLATFQGGGIAVSVSAGTTAAFTASASGPGIGACSAPFEFVNSAVAPTQYEHEPNDLVADANAVVLGSSGRADIAGVLDPVSGGGSDNFTFDVPPGASIRVGTFDRTGVTCDVTDTRLLLYAPAGGPGALDEDDGIGSCSRIDPVADAAAASAVAGGTYRVLVQGWAGADYQVRIEVLS